MLLFLVLTDQFQILQLHALTQVTCTRSYGALASP